MGRDAPVFSRGAQTRGDPLTYVCFPDPPPPGPRGACHGTSFHKPIAEKVLPQDGKVSSSLESEMILRQLLTLLTIAVLTAVPLHAQDTPSENTVETTQVMVLGLYHFDNPGADIVNSEVDDMLAPRRQREIAALVASLAKWQPTKIAVENTAPLPTLEMGGYARTQELLKTSRNETVQIGYRLGRILGHNAVYGYDERAGEGEPDYFPMGKVFAFAQENNGADLLNGLIAEVKAEANRESAERLTQTVAQSLIKHNDPSEITAKHDRQYYSLLSIGDGDKQPGAELNAYWYMRNAKMFAKIDMIAEPGDRVLVIAGSGHASWLRHFARRTPGYELVETVPYLEAAGQQTDETRSATATEINVGPELPYAFFQTPSAPGPHPAIIVLGGAEGGDQTARLKAKLFTQQGFAVLGLPYYLSDTSPYRSEFEQLPGTFNAIPVDQVEVAKAWLERRPDVRPDRIGIYGVSKGAEMALLSGSLIDGFAAIAAIVPSDVVWEGWGTGIKPGTISSFSWRGEPLPFVPYKGMQKEFASAAKEKRLIRFRDFHDRGRHANPGLAMKARIAVERIDEPVLVAGGDADIVWNSGEMAQFIAERRADAGLSTRSLVFLNAGHLLSGAGDGSDDVSDEELEAQKSIWPATLEFFRENLME